MLAHGGDEKHIPIQKNQVMSLGYDYVALGHIHKPQVIVADRMVYAGALEPIDKNDTGPHGYVSGQMSEQGCQISFVPMASREYIHLEVQVHKKMTGNELRMQIASQIQERGIQNIYKVVVTGFRDPDIIFDLEDMDTYGNIIELTDETRPAYEFEKLMDQNQDNLLGQYIKSLKDYEEDSIEYMALCEGVQALMETRRG